MRYNCNNCHKCFDFAGVIGYCPYCGSRLAAGVERPKNEIERGKAQEQEPKLTEVIDSIWGGRAKLRAAISSELLSVIWIYNRYAEKHLEDCLPPPDLTGFKSRYIGFKKSEDRKALLESIRKYLLSLDDIISELRDDTTEGVLMKIEKAAREVHRTASQLFDFIGKGSAPSLGDFLNEQSLSVTLLFTREQIRELYRQVLIAFEKYKRCVEDNDIFAAFASSSSYGTMQDYRRIHSSSLSGGFHADRQKLAIDDGEKRYEKIIHYMTEHNNMVYEGFLDENFAPHVDAFWHGLSTLCSFIDNRIRVDWKEGYFIINNEQIYEIRDYVNSEHFEISEERIAAVRALKKRIEEKEIEDE